MSEAITYDRRHFLGAAAMTIAAAQLGGLGSATAQASPAAAPATGSKPGASPAFGPLRQIDAGVLNVGYAEAGPADGPVVLLLHGWPYRTITGGVGHNLPQEAPQAFAQAVVDVYGYAKTSHAS